MPDLSGYDAIDVRLACVEPLGHAQIGLVHIQAAMRFAADTIAREEVVFIGKDRDERRD